MRKLLFIILISPITLISQSVFKGFGVFAAGTQSAHYYKNKSEDKRYSSSDTPDNYNLDYYYARTHASKEHFSWGAGLFAEFSTRDNLRWQTEFEYVKKGAKEKELLDPYFGTRSESFSTNKYTYIQWNNYLKFYNPIGFSSHWYIMPGIRLEYLLNQSVSAYQSIAGNFFKIWGSPNIALGYEFPLVRKWSAFTELHYNTDLLRHREGSTRLRNRTYELRIGVVYRPKRRGVDDCNAPRYNGPAY